MTCPERYRGEAVVQLLPIRNPALEGVEWWAPRPGHFTSRKAPVPTVHEAGWSTGPVWTARKIWPPPTFDPRTVQLYVQRYPGRLYIYIINQSNSEFLTRIRWNNHDTINSRYACGMEADSRFCTEFLVNCCVKWSLIGPRFSKSVLWSGIWDRMWSNKHWHSIMFSRVCVPPVINSK
jgi:hypothetical protein